jgi:hypothetical protein
VKLVCYLAHCLLNANAKVDEGARCAGVSTPVLALLRERGCTIRQMPAFRAHCRALAAPVAELVRSDLDAGARVVLIGIDGSPTMGVELTASSGEWGGRPDKPRDEDYPVTPGRGLFTETLIEMLGDRIAGVRTVGIGQDLLDYDEQEDLARLGRELQGSGGAP